jgi:acyl dehydratase
VTAPGVEVGGRRGPFAGCLDAEVIRRYAAATGDPSPLVRAGEAVPPVAIVTQIWEAQQAGFEGLVAPEVRASASGGVHGEHDVVLHRPIVPGEPLRTWVEGHGSRPAGRNALVTLRYETLDEHGELVAEQWWTTVLLGTTCAEAGAPPPDHAFPGAARARPLGSDRIDVDDGMARRYAEVSGDWSPHHFDPAAAAASGAPRPFLHGLCTMALCAQGAVAVVAGGDPDGVRRVAVRFASPTLVGVELTVDLHDAGAGAVAFEASAGGAKVITNGRLELR